MNIVDRVVYQFFPDGNVYEMIDKDTRSKTNADSVMNKLALVTSGIKGNKVTGISNMSFKDYDRYKYSIEVSKDNTIEFIIKITKDESVFKPVRLKLQDDLLRYRYNKRLKIVAFSASVIAILAATGKPAISLVKSGADKLASFVSESIELEQNGLGKYDETLELLRQREMNELHEKERAQYYSNETSSKLR